MFRNSNSFDGKFCIFSNVKFKRILKLYCERTGYTQRRVKDEIEEKYGIPVDTFNNWLKHTKPIDGEISVNGEYNDNATIVKLAKYFGVDTKELLDFPKNKKEIEMEIKSINYCEKYNNTQIDALKHINDVVMDYIILKCNVLDEYSNEYSTFQHYDYSKLVNYKFNTFKEDKRLFLDYIENIDLTNHTNDVAIKKYILKKDFHSNCIDIGSIDQGIMDFDKLKKVSFNFDNLPECPKDANYYLYEADTKAHMVQYGTNDEGLGNLLAEQSNDDSPYAYVLYEIYKISHILRKEFIDELFWCMEKLYLIYSVNVLTDIDIAKKIKLTDGSNLSEVEITDFKMIDYTKDILANEIKKYC